MHRAGVARRQCGARAGRRGARAGWMRVHLWRPGEGARVPAWRLFGQGGRVREEGTGGGRAGQAARWRTVGAVKVPSLALEEGALVLLSAVGGRGPFLALGEGAR